MKNLNLVVCYIVMLMLTACSSSRDVKGRDFEFESVIKNDIDLVSETHQQMVFNALKQLADKLYKRNPQEWKKAGYKSLDMAVRRITTFPFPMIEGKSGVECIRLSFDESYSGDRVGAFIVGLESMVLASYDNHRSFYLHNMLEAQKLYNSARNIELASWMIRSKYKSNGQLFLLSSAAEGHVNLSYERLFGKMINAQDMMAQIMADRNHRQIKNFIQAVATAFIPI